MIHIDAATAGLVVAVFVASIVECVEAFTIVLAMGMTRSWKAALVGTGAALVALSVLVAAAGVGLRGAISQSFLQFLIGSLLLVFGLQWLRKAILRATGLKSVHDEAGIFDKEREIAAKAPDTRRFGLDWFAFVVSLKGVFLEGVEVIFIVITFGLNASAREPRAMLYASLAAVAAFALVALAGIVVHRPLARVPENSLKFGVALLLCTFGTWWAAEGLGFFSPSGHSAEWPGGDLTLLAVLGAWALLAWSAVLVLRRLASPTKAGFAGAGSPK